MSTKPTNIIILCTDEMRWNALGVFGQQLPVSPHIDRWAQQGAAFDHCFTVHPKCTPSRSCCLSGFYPHSGGHRTLDLPLRKEEPNFARHFKQQGYQTVLIGRNHMLEEDALEGSIDHWFRPKGLRPLDTEETFKHPIGTFLAGKIDLDTHEFIDSRRTDWALNWIAHERDTTAPFFLWLNWEFPHPPYTAPRDHYGIFDRNAFSTDTRPLEGIRPRWEAALHKAYETDKFTESNWQEIQALYLEMCHLVDAQLDRVLSSLQEQNLLEDTLVVFWADHGDFAGERQLTEKWDAAMYDSITRVPLMMWGKDIPAGVRSSGLVETIDILPTLTELAGVAPMPGTDGKSFAPLLSEPESGHRDLVFCQGGQERALLERAISPDKRKVPCYGYKAKQVALYSDVLSNQRTKMIRDYDWKYICYADGAEELYDLRQDPEERHNRSGDMQYKDTLEAYRRKMLLKLIDADPALPHQDYLEA